MIGSPWLMNHEPNQPFWPYTRIRVNPTTTGETANGRSMSALRSTLPGKFRRTIRSAMVMPKMVLSGTVIRAISSVNSSARRASCWVAAFSTGVRPPEKVCTTMIVTGTISRARR